MAIRIITDTSCDLPISIQKEWDISIIPLKVFFGEKKYVSGKDITNEEFYKLLRKSDELPKTAQITPIEFEDALRPYVDAGDEVILMPISKELSGTYSAACIAQKSFPEGFVHVVDTVQVTFGLAILVEMAVRFRKEGLNATDIVKKLDEYKNKIRIYAVVGDLKYLRLGGRLSSASAVVGGVLGIKPLVSVVDGKVNNIDKARGLKAGFDKLINLVKEDNIDSDFPFYYAHTDNIDSLNEFREFSEKTFGDLDYRLTNIGSIVGTHVGPNVVGIGYVVKE